MSAWRERYLGVTEIPAELADLEVSEFFTLSPAEVRDITKPKAFGKKFQIAIGIQLCFLRMTGSLLKSYKVLPRPILEHVGQQLGVEPPTLASIRAIWKRPSTQTAHHDWVMRRLKFEQGTKKQFAMLLSHMRQASQGTSSIDRLIEQACKWMFDRKILIPNLKTVREICVDASKDTETALYVAICKATTPEQRSEWTEKVLGPGEGKRSVLEWLQQSPAKRGPKNLADLFAKIEYLKGLGFAEIDFGNVSKPRMQEFARSLQRRNARGFRRLTAVTQTLEMVSYLLVRLGQLSDAVVNLSAKMTSDIVSRAGRTVEKKDATTILSYREALSTIFGLAEDEKLEAATLRKEILVLRESFGDKLFPSRNAAIRSELAESENKAIRPLLKKLVELDIKGKEEDQGLNGLAILRDLYQKNVTSLPEDQKAASPTWDPLIKDEKDRERAMRAFEAETLRNVRRGFRRGSLWLDHGDAYRGRDKLLISDEDWKSERNRHYRLLNLPQDVESYLGPLLKAAERGVANVVAALSRGEIHLKDNDISLDKLEAQDEPAEVASVRAMIDAEIGEIQLPEMLLEMDVATRFSKALMGHLPRTDRELLLSYSALLGVGTDMTAKGVSMMVQGVSPDEILSAMATLESDKGLEEANKLVLAYINQLPIVNVWGDGSSASSDMMSLTTSKHLWNARLDPRRQTPSIGMYTHVHDRWPIIYNQPIVLGERQNGVAIEGVIRQTELDISRLGVDTHGYTEPAMAFARMLGFDLCPRIRNLAERSLKLPKDFAIPASLEGIAKASIGLDVVRQHWDDLVRVTASMSCGKLSAVTGMQRFGSAAQGDPIYRAAQALGQLQLTVFLCDFFTKPEFRREITRLLNRGEHVHTLQHAIHLGSVRHDRGRHPDEIVAISAGLTLLSNITIAWNAKRMQAAVDSLQKKGVALSKDVLRHISPVRYSGINFRGVFSFPMERYRSALFFNADTKLKLVRG